MNEKQLYERSVGVKQLDFHPCFFQKSDLEKRAKMSKIKTTSKSMSAKLNDHDEFDFKLDSEDDLFDDFDELNTKKPEQVKFRHRSNSSSSDSSNPASEPKNGTKSKQPVKSVMYKSMIAQKSSSSGKLAPKPDDKLLVKVNW